VTLAVPPLVQLLNSHFLSSALARARIAACSRGDPVEEAVRSERATDRFSGAQRRHLPDAGITVMGWTAHQKREAIKRRDRDGETLRSIARSYNVSAATISRLPLQA
jgi:hypothetical protein